MSVLLITETTWIELIPRVCKLFYIIISIVLKEQLIVSIIVTVKYDKNVPTASASMQVQTSCSVSQNTPVQPISFSTGYRQLEVGSVNNNSSKITI